MHFFVSVYLRIFAFQVSEILVEQDSDFFQIFESELSVKVSGRFIIDSRVAVYFL